MEEIFIPITMFLMIAAVVWTVMHFRFRSRQELQMTIRDAVSAGQSLSPAALEDLMQAMQPKRSDLRRGLIWIALALGMLVFASTVDESGVVGPLLGAASFPLFIGLAYFLLWRLGGDS